MTRRQDSNNSCRPQKRPGTIQTDISLEFIRACAYGRTYDKSTPHRSATNGIAPPKELHQLWCNLVSQTVDGAKQDVIATGENIQDSLADGRTPYRVRSDFTQHSTVQSGRTDQKFLTNPKKTRVVFTSLAKKMLAGIVRGNAVHTGGGRTRDLLIAS